jgi:hypothetical protein
MGGTVVAVVADNIVVAAAVPAVGSSTVGGGGGAVVVDVAGGHVGKTAVFAARAVKWAVPPRVEQHFAPALAPSTSVVIDGYYCCFYLE